MAKIETLSIKQIISADHLKAFKPAQLKKVVEVLNATWFSEPVSSTTKPAMAKAIGELALTDAEFRNKHYEDNPEATFNTLDDLIIENTDFNNSLSSDLTDEEYEAQCKKSAMITPDEIENGKANGLTDDVLETIKNLTGVDYLEMYGFGTDPEEEGDPEEDLLETAKTIEAPEEKEKKVEPQNITDTTKTADATGEMGINTIDFQEALEKVAPGLGKEENEDLVRFEGEHIRTYSSNISVLHPFSTGIRGSVAGKDLVTLAKKLPAQDLNLSQTENKMMIKGAAGADIEFNFNTLMMPHIEVPGEDATWMLLPKSFSDMVAVAALSCSAKARNPIYNCVVIEKDSVVACENGHRGIEVYMESEFEGKMNIHGKMAKELTKYHPFEVCIDKAYFHFRNAQGTIVSIRQYASGEFSKAFYDNLLHKGIEVDIPRGTKQLVERSSILAGKGSHDYVTVDVKNSKMVIKGRSETGCLTETIQLKNNEIEVSFAIHPILFKEVLGISTYMEICENYILFKGDQATCWISKTVPNN